MRREHKSLGRLQEGFEADTAWKVVLMAIEERELVDQDRSQSNPLGVDQALRRDLGMTLKDPLEMFVEVFDRPAAQLMEDPPHGYPAIGVGVRSILRHHQDPLALLTGRPHVGSVIVEVSEDEPGLWRQFVDQTR